MKIKKIAYLIHSMLYSQLAADDLQGLRDRNQTLYLERELLCEQRWRAAIRRLPSDAIYAQLTGGQDILAYAREQLGDDRVIAPTAEWREGLDAEEYRLRLTESFRTQLAAKGHEFDSETVELELWGESFEGCVYTYGSTLARHLGLKRPPFDNFDLTVPDARFLCKADWVTSFLLPGTAVRGYVFDVPEGYPVGVFIDGFYKIGDGQPAPTDCIRIPLDSTKVTLTNSVGITLFAQIEIERPGGRRIPIQPHREHDGISGTTEALEIPRGVAHYILGTHISQADLIAAMESATLAER